MLQAAPNPQEVSAHPGDDPGQRKSLKEGGILEDECRLLFNQRALGTRLEPIYQLISKPTTLCCGSIGFSRKKSQPTAVQLGLI